MIQSLQLYFNAFKHYSDEGQRKISYLELMGISWALHLIYAFYSVFALYLGVKSYDYFSNSQDFTHLILDSFSFKMQKLSLLSTLFGVIIYPLVFHFGYKFWKGLLGFYARLFEARIPARDEVEHDILSSFFSSNLFLLMPIIGNLLSNIASAFFLFQGLRHKYEFSILQASLVLLTPLFLIFLFTVFTASYFVFLFTLL